jgi:hypothetical protein
MSDNANKEQTITKEMLENNEDAAHRSIDSIREKGYEPLLFVGLKLEPLMRVKDCKTVEVAVVSPLPPYVQKLVLENALAGILRELLNSGEMKVSDLGPIEVQVDGVIDSDGDLKVGGEVVRPMNGGKVGNA